MRALAAEACKTEHSTVWQLPYRLCRLASHHDISRPCGPPTPTAMWLASRGAGHMARLCSVKHVLSAVHHQEQEIDVPHIPMSACKTLIVPRKCRSGLSLSCQSTAKDLSTEKRSPGACTYMTGTRSKRLGPCINDPLSLSHVRYLRRI